LGHPVDDDLTNEERETQKKVREMVRLREERDRGKGVKIGYREIQINGEWFRWDEREEKLKYVDIYLCIKGDMNMIFP
jgi:hypothetical protein